MKIDPSMHHKDGKSSDKSSKTIKKKKSTNEIRIEAGSGITL